MIACLAFPVAAQEAAEVPGDPQSWFTERAAEAAALAPDLSALQSEALLRAQWSVTTRECPASVSAMRLYGLQPATADRLVTAGILDDAFAGAWTFYGETDCPNARILRFMYVLEKSGEHIMLVVNRGNTITTPSMMRETSAEVGADVYAMAKARQPGCDIESVRMNGARVEATDRALGPMVAGTRFTGGWSEIWSFRACQQDVEARVRFDTDGKGGTTARVMGMEVVG